MKLVIKLGAAIGLVALSACGQAGQDEAADTTDANAGMSAGEGALPVDENAAGTDTLGNQLNQLNQTDSTSANAATGEDATANTAENTTNSY